MAAPFPPNTPLGITCSKCGKTTTKTLAELQSGQPFSCTCGNAFDPAEIVSKTNEAIELLKKKLKNM